MAIYSYICYRAFCDGCGMELPGGPFAQMNEPREALLSTPGWKLIRGKGYCPKCTRTIEATLMNSVS